MFPLDDLKKLDPTKLDLKKLDPTKLDLKKLDPTKLDLKKLDPTKLDLTRLELPRFDLPKFTMPARPELPKVDVPVDVDRLASFARDAAYVGVGAAVVAARAADERRKTLTHDVTARVRKLVDAVA